MFYLTEFNLLRFTNFFLYFLINHKNKQNKNTYYVLIYVSIQVFLKLIRNLFIKSKYGLKMTLKKYERDKEAKIHNIIRSTKILVETKGYTLVSIRDIAKEADVSIGLIYKYFPKGKFDILKQLSSQYIEKEFMMKQPDKIDFTDFPGYMREVSKNMLKSHKKNAKLINAVTVAALMEDDILEDIKMVKTEDYMIISEFFSRFTGVNISSKNHEKVLKEWSLTIKSLIFYNNIFSTIFNNNESLLDMLVDISLKIWEYKP